MKPLTAFATLVSLSILISLEAAASAKVEVTRIESVVTEKGFEPANFDVPVGIPVELKITRKTNDTCATQVIVPSKGIKKDLPLNKAVTIKLGKLNVGDIKFGCQMAMMVGAVISIK